MARPLNHRPLIGIDPGITGAIVIIDGPDVHQYDMPTVTKPSGKREVNGTGVASILRKLPENTVVFLELVNAMPPRRKKNKKGEKEPAMGTASAMSFGEASGVVRGVIETLGYRLYRITPGQWKRKAGLTGKPKDYARAAAIGLYPSMELHLKKHVAQAEAALIAHYGARIKGEV